MSKAAVRQGDDDDNSDAGLSDDDGATEDVLNTSQQDRTTNDFQVLTPKELLVEMQKITEEVKEVIGYPSSICRILLAKFKWSKMSLLERYYDYTGNEGEFFKKMNIVNPQKALSKIEESSGECALCLETMQLFGIQCGHKCCSECWDSYLTNKVTTENQPHVSCPTSNCSNLIDDETAMKLITTPDMKEKYKAMISNSFVDSNSLLKWCPAPDCGHVIKVPHAECRPVTCKCGLMFCFKCSNEWHEPVNCAMLKSWEKKCRDDSETSHWLSANTKDCPKCNMTIEKNGGCNHMTCKNHACRYEFCWICLGVWGPHGTGWYSCNRFDDKAAKQARDQQDRSRVALQRYLHYFNRFMNHQNSLKMEKNLKDQVQVKIEAMLKSNNFSWIETQFLKEAVEILHNCRRTLMYSYAFAFYLEQSNMTTIFENNQADLERATERLSEYLERDLGNENAKDLSNLKRRVQDMYRYVDQRRGVLLRHCNEGTERNEWKFNTT